MSSRSVFAKQSNKTKQNDPQRGFFFSWSRLTWHDLRIGFSARAGHAPEGRVDPSSVLLGLRGGTNNSPLNTVCNYIYMKARSGLLLRGVINFQT